MIGRLRQLSEPRLRQQARIEKSQTPVERDILVQWVRKLSPSKMESVPYENSLSIKEIMTNILFSSIRIYV